MEKIEKKLKTWCYKRYTASLIGNSSKHSKPSNSVSSESAESEGNMSGTFSVTFGPDVQAAIPEAKQATFNNLIASTKEMQQDIIKNTTRIITIEESTSTNVTNITELQATTKSVEDEILVLVLQVETLTQRCHFLKQEALSTTTEIDGLWVKSSEDLTSTMCQIATHLEVPLKKEGIISFYRLRSRRKNNISSPLPSIVVVKTNLRATCSMLIEQYKMKRDCWIQMIGWSEEQTLYIIRVTFKK